MSLIDKLEQNALAQPHGEAMLFLDGFGAVHERLTHGELLRRAKHLACSLRSRNAAAKDAFLIFEHGPEFAVSFYACLFAGLTIIPLPPLEEQRLPFQCRHIQTLTRDLNEAPFFLSGGPTLALLKQHKTALGIKSDEELVDTRTPLVMDPGAFANRDWGHAEPAALLYTSGSTSRPKGVKLNQSHFQYNARTCVEAWELEETSVAVSWMPNHHSFGLIFNLLLPLFSGCRIVCMSPRAFVQKPLLWLKTLSDYRATHSAAATFGYRLCTEKIPAAELQGIDLSRWKVGLVSAEPIGAHVYRDFFDKFGPYGLRPDFFCALYGLSETGPITTMPVGRKPRFHREEGHPAATALACVGKPFSGTQLVCVNPSGGICREGVRGEIFVAGPSVTTGYLAREEENRAAFRRLGAEGHTFFGTGDEGFLEDGFLYVTGRLKEIIIIHGKNYYPQDMEWLLKQSDARLGAGNVAVFSLETESGPAEPRIMAIAESVPVEEAGYAALAQKALHHVSANLGVEIHELMLVPLGAVPKTASGKLKRKTCLEMVLQGQWRPLFHLGAPENPAPAVAGASERDVSIQNPSTVTALADLFSLELNMPRRDFGPDLRLSRLRLDSIQYLELAQAIESHLSTPCSPTLFFKSVTLADLAGHLEAARERVDG